MTNRLRKRRIFLFLSCLGVLLTTAACNAGQGNTAAVSRAQDAGPGNVILFLGDGMGVSTVTAARIYAGQKAGAPGEEHVLSFEAFPEVALIKTYNTDWQVSDSAGTMTALVTGEKTRAGVLSIKAEVERGDCASAQNQTLPTLLEQAEQAGMRTGLISTARITHATPAATYAHSADRNWEDDQAMSAAAIEAGCVDIARQLIEFPHGDGVDLILGGGRANFYPQGAQDPEYQKPLGRRLDGRNLIEDWRATNQTRTYVWNRSEFRSAMASLTPGSGQLLGLFEPSHMQWEADRNTELEPSLAEMTVAAVDFLSADNRNGYFLMVEAGRIDHAHHGGNAYRALEDTLALDEAVAATLAKVDLEETLIIVTADHSHTLTISGYPARGNPILGKARDVDGVLLKDASDRPYTTLGYANGPGAQNDADLTEVDTTDPNYRQVAGVPMASETHAGEDVAAYAIGRNAEGVGGVMEQNLLFQVMQQALFTRDRP